MWNQYKRFFHAFKKYTYAISAAAIIQPPSLAVTDYEKALRICRISLHKIINNRMQRCRRMYTLYIKVNRNILCICKHTHISHSIIRQEKACNSLHFHLHNLRLTKVYLNIWNTQDRTIFFFLQFFTQWTSNDVTFLFKREKDGVVVVEAEWNKGNVFFLISSSLFMRSEGMTHQIGESVRLLQIHACTSWTWIFAFKELKTDTREKTTYNASKLQFLQRTYKSPPLQFTKYIMPIATSALSASVVVAECPFLFTN